MIRFLLFALPLCAAAAPIIYNDSVPVNGSGYFWDSFEDNLPDGGVSTLSFAGSDATNSVRVYFTDGIYGRAGSEGGGCADLGQPCGAAIDQTSSPYFAFEIAPNGWLRLYDSGHNEIAEIGLSGNYSTDAVTDRDGTILLDRHGDVTITDTPEPGSLALIAAGMLALLVNRSRRDNHPGGISASRG